MPGGKMAAYCRVYDSRHLQADCQELGSSPERYARQSSEYGLPLRFPLPDAAFRLREARVATRHDRCPRAV